MEKSLDIIDGFKDQNSLNKSYSKDDKKNKTMEFIMTDD